MVWRGRAGNDYFSPCAIIMITVRSDLCHVSVPPDGDMPVARARSGPGAGRGWAGPTVLPRTPRPAAVAPSQASARILSDREAPAPRRQPLRGGKRCGIQVIWVARTSAWTRLPCPPASIRLTDQRVTVRSTQCECVCACARARVRECACARAAAAGGGDAAG